jgi:hypothetical protein
MATRYIDPNIQLPQSATGVASFYPAVLDALIAANNLTALTDAKNLPNAVAAPGAIDPTYRFTTLAVDGTDAYTLANGTYPGQQVTCFVISGANIPVGTITPATPTGFATVTALGAVGDLVTFMWTGAGWVVTSAFGVTFT